MPMLRPLVPLLLAAAAACAGSPAPVGGPVPFCPTGEVEIVAPGVVSTAASEYNPSLSPDGRTLVFARAERGFENAKIHVSRWTRAGWSEPRPISFTDARHTDSDPTFSPDGRTLYFISTRPAPGDTTRDLDVWRAERNGDGWSTPERLGVEVNSPGPELGPTLHDGWLYFGSARRGGAGGLDLNRARAAGTGFEAAETLGTAINGAGSEGDPELSRDGRTLLFWSDRPGGAGEGDLHLARRTADGWSAPGPIAAANSPRFDFTPSISPDGRWLYFASTRTEAPGAPAAVLGGESNIYRIRLSPSCPAR
ncbi:MAG TPA: hypothetical protein VFR81_06405 [Longimicrobium sp.]|nr:hypothetical protein [Longimicrobium sp.]